MGRWSAQIRPGCASGRSRPPCAKANSLVDLVAANTHFDIVVSSEHDNDFTRVRAAHIATALHIVYILLRFATPLILCSVLRPFAFIFLTGARHSSLRIALPRYPVASHRDVLFLVIGEVHKPRKPLPVERPQWLAIPRRELFSGIGVFGAVGKDKTSCCIYAFAEQLHAYRRADPDRRVGGLVLEVKGDFCYRLQEILSKHGLESDYVEISLDCP